MPLAAHVVGTHRWTNLPAQTPALQGMQGSHVPQSIGLPHPSSCVPQLNPCSAHVFGTHAEQGGPVSAPQGPQSTGLPQKSVVAPQQPCSAHDLGVQGVPRQQS
jgi:hypothetical protein